MKNHGFTYHDAVPAAGGGASVLEFYCRRYPHSGPAQWRERILAGRVLRNGAPTRPDTLLEAKDRLEWRRPPWEEPDAPRDFGVLREQDSFLVADKPSGLPVLPGAGFLENTLLHLLRERYGPRCTPLHRLGRWTSGAVLCARSPRAARELGRAMQERRIGKVYLALVEGTDLPDAFTVDAPIGPVSYPPTGTLHAALPRGRPARSDVRVVRRMNAIARSLVEVHIHTGRPHQIRIHLAHAGWPLAGDPLYGPGGRPRQGGALPGDGGYRLHAWKLCFPHPETQAPVHVESPPPDWTAG